MKQSLRGIAYFGTSYSCYFLEVCSGTATLTQAVRYVGLTAMAPVDLLTGWDLTLRSHCLMLRARIKEWRPLLVHFAPVCRIFSQAFHPLSLPKYYTADESYKRDMTLAVNISHLAKHVYSLGLFVGCLLYTSPSPRDS